MALAPGQRLGPFEVISAIGAGGMGEVYQARDTRLDRVVAIKVLPSHLSSNPDLKARFEREAKSISGLQHPNICVLHDVGSQDGIDFLVMEYLEGETLAERIAKKPLSQAEAFKTAIEVADALDKAHRSNIIHRDLKPGNVMLTKSGAKLMDFGLAKPTSFAGTQSGAPAFSAVATMSTPLTPITMAGTVVGTIQYMSPEQIQGQDADARSDIFAFGAVLYEMTTGKRPFEGKSQLSMASAILEKEPERMSAIQPLTPAALEHVVETCLAKDPAERWQTAADLARELRWISQSSGQMAALPKSGKKIPWAIIAGVAVSILAVAGVLLLRNRGPAPVRLVAAIPPPPDMNFGVIGDVGAPPAISPDGTRLVYGAGGQIWLRSLDTGEFHTIEGTEGGSFPFWSPDNRFIGFFSGGKLRVVDINGGSPATICDASNARGGTWSQNGTILFSPNIRSVIYKVAATGGTPVAVTVMDADKHSTHRWPQFLPDGEHFLYLAANHSTTKIEFSGIYVSSLSNGKEAKLLMRTDGNALYASGNLLFVRKSDLMAQPVDIDRVETRGEPVRVLGDTLYDQGIWRGVFTVSNNGVLVAATGVNSAAQGQLSWFDATGKILGTVGDKGVSGPHLSPDGTKVAVQFGDPNSDVWIFNVQDKVRTRFTTSGNVFSPVWSPDGKSIVFAKLVPNTSRTNLVIRRVDGSTDESFFHPEDSWQLPTDWSPDGKYILYERGDPGATDLFVMPLAPGEKPRPFVQTPAWERDAHFSPDGHWVLYTSRESGRDEIYVSPFPGPGPRWQISTTGAGDPRWRHDGKAVFAINNDDVLMFPITVNNGTIQSAQPTVLFHTAIGQNILFNASFDVSKDGRFLLNSLGKSNAGNRPLTIVMNWNAGSKK